MLRGAWATRWNAASPSLLVCTHWVNPSAVDVTTTRGSQAPAIENLVTPSRTQLRLAMKLIHQLFENTFLVARLKALT
eukprot:7250787-Pyramimonas_sp.AAC.1